MLVPCVATKRLMKDRLIGDVADGRRRQRLGDEVTPEPGTGGPDTGNLAGKLAHQVGAPRAEHHGHHERAGAIGVLHDDSVHLGDGLGEKGARLEKGRGFHPGQGERGCHSHRGNHGAGTNGRTTGGDRREVATLENGDDLRGRRVRLCPADRANMREHNGALDREHSVDATEQLGVYGDIFTHGG
jgi:hypothetical protein